MLRRLWWQLDSKSLANSSIEECQQHAQRIREGYLAGQWDALGGIVAIAHSFILRMKVYPSLAAVTAIEMASTRYLHTTTPPNPS